MKSTLAILIAGLIFLATPLLATAHGGDRYEDGSRHTKGWVKDRHDNDYYRYDRSDKWEQRQAKKHFKQHVRKHRRSERRHFARHHQPRYVEPAVVFGVPRIVFRIDW